MAARQLVKILLIILAAHCTSAQENITDAELVALSSYNNVNNTTQSQSNGNIMTQFSNEYFLYTRQNPTTAQILVYNNRSSILSSNFKASLQTIVIVHGWTDSANGSVNVAIRDAYFNVSHVNVIVVDWSQLADRDYITATLGAPETGRNLGTFLNYLVSVTGASLNNMHMIGFSLGAHVVGNAGRELNGAVARITGLDPAGPLWNTNLNRLRYTDGVYTEIIHTNKGLLGTVLNMGDNDFYPNGGSSQPGCLSPGCNHDRSWQLLAASIINENLIGKKCGSYVSLLLTSCYGMSLPLGTTALYKNGSNDIYYLRTGSNYPYYLTH